jgi:iron(III) transport system permease protein
VKLRLAQTARPVLWTAVCLVILLPCACFLALAVSPRLFDQGQAWFTLANLRQVLTGTTAVAFLNSIWVSAAAAALGLLVGFPIAWAVARTTLPGRRVALGVNWLVLLLPSWLPALGWVRLVQDDGVLDRLGIGSALFTHAILGPFGVVLLLGLRVVPFSYLAVSAALLGLGQELEDAARVHGASRLDTLRLLVPIMGPALWSALAIGFAESVSDFGVAATLAYSAHFSLATYQLYAAIDDFPPNFPAAAAMSWLLVASVAVPLVLQARSLRGRSYAVLSGRTRQVVRHQLSRAATAAAAAVIGLYWIVALGVPGFGAVSGSLLGDFGSSFDVTLVNYRAVLHNSGVSGPLERSLAYAGITASITVAAGFVAARLLAQRRGRAARLLDLLLLSAVALPGVVFGAGYIFAYNLPVLSRLGIDIYQTTTLLIVAYVASSLPTNARVLVGAVSQVQSTLQEAARAHGAGLLRAWGSGVLPVVSRPLVMAWLLTFCGIFLELPLSQLLYAPGSPPLSVAVQDNLGNYHFGVGMAQSVTGVVFALGVVAVVLGAYRLLAPKGWRRIGAGIRG